MRRSGRLVTLAALTAVVAMVIAATMAGQRGEPGVKRKVPLEWGLYQILWSRDYDRHLTDTVSRFASKPKYVMFYRDLNRPFPSRAIDAVARHGATAVVSLELWTWHGRREGSYLPAINQGDFDEFLRSWARAAKEDGRRVLLRFGFEFNGDWFTWSGEPAAYVAAFRHAHDIFRDVGAGNVEWVWAPNIVSCPDTDANDMHRYYPGDDYVDWVALDGYNFGDHHDEWHRWQSFEDVYAAALRDFARRYGDKPLIITEFGCAPGKPGQRAAWIREAFGCLQRFPQVRAAIWFNYDKRRENEPDWRIDRDPEALKAFNETFAAPARTP